MRLLSVILIKELAEDTTNAETIVMWRVLHSRPRVEH